MGEEKEAAWPERSEGLVRPVLCVCVSYVPQREAGFVSFVPFQSWAPQELRATPFLFFKASPAFSHLLCYGLGASQNTW